MHSLKYRLKTLSPVVLSTYSGDMNMVTTARHISGTVVLGMLAKRFIDQLNGERAHEQEDFYNWFLAGRLKIGNAYIFSPDEPAYYPTPFSLEKEKYRAKIAYDRLHLEQEPSERTEHAGDFCFLDGNVLQTRAVETEINFHHARNREKGISEEGLIFNYESIAANQIFAGEICGEKEDLQNLLQRCGSAWTAHVGRAKNSQYGAIEFKIIDHEPVATQIRVDWVGSDDEADDEVESEGGQGEPGRDWRIVFHKKRQKAPENLIPISMTLLSDLILYNECGYPTTDVNDLQKALEKRLGQVRIEKAFVKKTEAESFVGVWRLKKPSETCFAAGSAFLLQVAREHVERIATIQETGLGERTHEGFGRCVFGWQTQRQLDLTNATEKEAEREAPKPDSPAPAMTKKIVKEIVQKIMRESIELEAANKQASFVRLPSNALIAKLHELARNAGARNDFVSELNKLRKLAADQLRNCVSREHNLLEFLAAFQVDLPRFFAQTRNADLKDVCKEIEYAPEVDDQLKRHLTKSFYTAFFAMMRERKIAEEEEGRNVERQ